MNHNDKELVELRADLKGFNASLKEKPKPLYECFACGRGFATKKAARNAMKNGCPQCGSSDINLATVL